MNAGGRRIRRVVRRGICAAGVIAMVALPAAAEVDPNADLYNTGPSDATCLELYYFSCTSDQRYHGSRRPMYDHPDLTIAVHAAPNTDPEMVASIHAAIATWRGVLKTNLPYVSLTDVTDTSAGRKADIDANYVPHFGGVSRGGQANCVPNHCEIFMKSEQPPGGPWRDFTPNRLFVTSLHEIGHALGLGHAYPLTESTDVMAYGPVWAVFNPETGMYDYQYKTPIISECDIKGIAANFAWVPERVPPHTPAVGTIAC